MLILAFRKSINRTLNFKLHTFINVNTNQLYIRYAANGPTLGTPYYMPPETIANNEISFSSDIWALGCIVYELCMLRHPFAIAKVYMYDMVLLFFFNR